VGADLKAACCHVSGRRAWLSQHVGDLGHLRTLQAMDACIDHLSSLSGVEAETVAVDAHPGYLSRRLGHARGDPVEVQHHHAHAASLMAEAGHSGAEPIIAFVFDGTGHGADRSPWGGEVLLADYQHAERWGHLENVQLPGGDAAVANPYRTALAHLSAAGLTWDADLAPVTACEDAERAVLARQLSTGMGCVATSSMGRLFDAVASLLDLRHRITYEAQAAIDLEALAATHRGPVPPLCFGPGANGDFDAAPVLAALVEGLRAGLEPSALAAAFHEAVVEAMLRAARRIRADRSLEVVGLTGGVFQNAVLSGLATRRLAEEGFEVLNHRVVPPNDGGLALGQAVIAGCAAQRAQPTQPELPTQPSLRGMTTCV
jgi:hydrogenase maturation protein HypF